MLERRRPRDPGQAPPRPTGAAARAQGVPVLWVQHEDEELVAGTPAWQWTSELAPADGEGVIPKRFNSSFEEATLEDELAWLGASHVVLAGAATNWCIRATAYGALDRGYDLTLVEDGHTTGPIESSDGRVVAAEDIVRELNAVIGWISYRGRTSAVAAADEVDFGAGA